MGNGFYLNNLLKEVEIISLKRKGNSIISLLKILYALHKLKPSEIEPSLEYLINKIHPDDIHFIKDYQNKLFMDFLPVSYETRLIQSDGSVLWLQNNIIPIVENNTESVSGLQSGQVST